MPHRLQGARAEVRVTRELLDAYADAVGAPAGAYAPPLFSVVAGYPLLFAAVDSVTPAEVRHRTVHGDHEVTVVRPARLGDVLSASAEVQAVHASRAGTSVLVRIDVNDRDGAAVAVHRAVAIVRGAPPAAEIGPAVPRPDPEPSAWSWTAVVAIAADQPVRYADATGDRNAVHVDDAAARGAGFAGVIAHGLGVFGLVLSALIDRVAGGDPAAVRRARVRFGAPVRPGQDLRIDWSGVAPRFAFRAADATGAPVLRSGVVELASAAGLRTKGGRLDLDQRSRIGQSQHR
jgi:acyl dehydratase